jgi:hypothetical protein
VRPILSNRCFKCHGPDEDHREAGLRLDVREAARAELDNGTRAIVPGHPDDSEVIARITSTDPDLVMPPPHTKVTLAEEERRILTDWIAAGAEYRPHWAFVTPERPAVAKEETDTWSRSDVDRLVTVMQKLVDRGDSLVVIEHHPTVLAAADWVLELGPGGGREGGRVVAEVSKKWFAFTDTYGVDIADGEDAVLILASTVVIDMIAHPDAKPKAAEPKPKA